MIIQHITQNPGQMEQSSKDYRGYKYRTIVFNDDWVDAMFLEINGKLIEKWKTGDKVTSGEGEEY